MEICEEIGELFCAEDEKEKTCLRLTYKLINDNKDLQPMRKFWTNKLALIAIRSFGCDAHKVIRVMKRLLHSCTMSYPDLFALINYSKLQPVLDKNIFQIINTGGNEGCNKSPGMLVLRINRWNPNEVSLDELIAVGVLYAYTVIKDSAAIQRNGGVLIIDADGFNFNHVKVLSFDTVKKMNCLLNTLPIKFVGSVIINSPKVVEQLFNIFKYVLRAKNRKLIHVVHKNLKPLHDMLPAPDSLPRCFGGKVDDEIGLLHGVEEFMGDDTTLSRLVEGVQNEYKMRYK